MQASGSKEMRIEGLRRRLGPRKNNSLFFRILWPVTRGVTPLAILRVQQAGDLLGTDLKESKQMSAIAIETVPFDGGNFEGGKYVQQMFDWDTPAVAATPVVRTTAPTAISASPSVPSQSTPSQAIGRRGRCEHVGSVMGAVLSKYGLGIDDLLRAIEERQAQVGITR
jgi:hypothetical protein